MVASIETTDQLAEARRIHRVAHAVADLHLLYEVLSDDISRSVGRIVDPSNPYESLYPNPNTSVSLSCTGEPGVQKLRGFLVHDTKAYGGTTDTLHYNVTREKVVTMSVHEWAAGTMMPDFLEEPDIFTPDQIARSASHTGIFALKAQAAFSLLKTSRRQQERYRRIAIKY